MSEQAVIPPTSDASGQRSPFLLTALRVRYWQLPVVLLVAGVFWWSVPHFDLWSNPISVTADQRIARPLAEDYWLYRKRLQGMSSWAEGSELGVLVVGDSVVWGEYVPGDATLSAELGRLVPGARFLNGGLNGLHPLAIEGLLRDYGQPLRNGPTSCRNVLLHFNLLWLTSPERDLSASDQQGLSFNHPSLLPQLWRSPPSYDADASTRLGTIVERNWMFQQWKRHIRLTHFDGQSLHGWTLSHPMENPLGTWRRPAVLFEPETGPAARRRREARSWIDRGLQPQSADWVALQASQQWQALLRTLDDLRRDSIRTFVLVGPLNEHLLTQDARGRHRHLLHLVEKYLREGDVPFLVADTLPAGLYADLSHPLSTGYTALAERLARDRSFQRWLARGD